MILEAKSTFNSKDKTLSKHDHPAYSVIMNTVIRLAIALCSLAVIRGAAEESSTNLVLRLDGKTGCMVVADSPSLQKGQAQMVEIARLASIAPEALPNPPAAKPALTVEKRLEILEDLWRHLRDIYPALEYKGITGHEWIEPTAERVRQAKSDLEFYGLLLELMASLKDTHTHIAYYPGQPDLEAPPVWLNQVEGKVAVVRADEGTGLSPGDVLVAVDGQPVEERLAAEMKRVCNSTERGRVRGACERLLRGEPGSTVTATFESPDKGVRQVTLLRKGRAELRDEPVISSRRLGESIGYVRISSWGGENLVADFDQALEQFKGCAGLIIDVRGNGGGDDHLADLVNGRLTDRPVVSSIDFWRQTGSDQYKRTIGWVQPRGPWTYRGRVAVLIDEGCASACEHFVSGIEGIGSVLMVGMPTDGAGGGPTMVTLNDGTKVVISRALGLRANGVVFEGHGLPPHIYASSSLSDLRQGRDAALELAKEWLLSSKPLPERNQRLP
jgi:carboxyl-terminal processing protease